jgi:hypothetical protein
MCSGSHWLLLHTSNRHAFNKWVLQGLLHGEALVVIDDHQFLDEIPR